MRISKFTQAILMVVFAFLVFKFAIRPPIPSSLLYFYMMIVIFAIFIYVISNTQLLQAFLSPIKSVLVEEKKKGLGWLFLPYYLFLQQYLLILMCLSALGRLPSFDLFTRLHRCKYSSGEI